MQIELLILSGERGVSGLDVFQEPPCFGGFSLGGEGSGEGVARGQRGARVRGVKEKEQTTVCVRVCGLPDGVDRGGSVAGGR